jgi:hypothetical protein
MACFRPLCSSFRFFFLWCFLFFCFLSVQPFYVFVCSGVYMSRSLVVFYSWVFSLVFLLRMKTMVMKAWGAAGWMEATSSVFSRFRLCVRLVYLPWFCFSSFVPSHPLDFFCLSPLFLFCSPPPPGNAKHPYDWNGFKPFTLETVPKAEGE